ncbi:RES domain-containing protein [uncultured Thiodictyon sp.]|uniref:RES family NAD+ phosphorylase n=1 Tax=uncultured Thiodictyon sp. TaxID=1846217 RepID=UPI0025FA4E1E|nr:RES domain-containing protein [uncultured Thiodictyon sp.]
MLTVWRIVTARFAEGAFSGEGARRYGGRWNRKGVPLVYTAGSQSLAMLEMLVQDEPLRARYMMIPAQLPADLTIARLSPKQLPADWRDAAALETLRALGTDWAAGLRAAVLAVPSAVVPAETNYLLNPRHPDFGRIGVGEAQELVTDLRLMKVKTPALGGHNDE